MTIEADPLSTVWLRKYRDELAPIFEALLQEVDMPRHDRPLPYRRVNPQIQDDYDESPTIALAPEPMVLEGRLDRWMAGLRARGQQLRRAIWQCLS